VDNPDVSGRHDLHVGLPSPPEEVGHLELGRKSGGRHGGAGGHNVGHQLDAALWPSAGGGRLVDLFVHRVLLGAPGRLGRLLRQMVLLQLYCRQKYTRNSNFMAALLF